MKRFLLTAFVVPSALIAQTVVEESPPSELAAKVAEATAAAEAGGQGPFKAVMLSDPSLSTHTLYLPSDIKGATRRGKLPIIAWGNGACTNIGNRFRYFLTEVASNGYFIVAVGPKAASTAEWKINLNPGDARPPTERTPGSYAAQLTDAIDWAVAENSRKASPYFGKLDTRAIAVMGQSCGGLQAISAAADKRVKTAIIWNSGTFPDGTKPLAGTGDANKASLKRLHTPVAWISGDDSDIAWVNANADYDAATHIPTLRAWAKGTGHSEVYREPKGGVYAPVGIAWLNWHLKDNKAARAMFVGSDCSLCQNPAWVIKTNKLK
jgi:dienelactone hydrolase